MSRTGDFFRRLGMTGEQRQEEDEINRDVKVRMGKSRIKRHLAHQQKMEGRYLELGRQALALGDNDRFRQIARQLLWTRSEMVRWAKYVLSMDVLEARREQVKATVSLMRSVKAMSESMIELAGPQEAAEMQRQLQEGLARAESLDERMSIMMEMMDSTLEDGTPDDNEAVADIEKNLREQNAQSDTASFDKDIEDGLRKIRDEMKNPNRK